MFHIFHYLHPWMGDALVAVQANKQYSTNPRDTH